MSHVSSDTAGDGLAGMYSWEETGARSQGGYRHSGTVSTGELKTGEIPHMFAV